MNFGRRDLFALGAGMLLAPRVRADSFEVASIKPSAPGQRGVRINIAPGGRFTANNVTVKMLIAEAYNIRDFQVIGGPGWLGSERYDITAKAEGDNNVGPDAFRPMLQSLLAERFKMKSHMETKELPVYALVVGKGGPKIKESDPETKGPMIRMGRGQLSGQGVAVEMLCHPLSNILGRTVTDQTGLKGKYDFKLEFTPEEGQMMGPREGGEAPPPPDASGPSIFTAVQEQLGLKLEGRKGPVQVLLIDGLEKASEN